VIHRLDYGGLENGVVNLINRLPPAEFEHAVVSVTDSTDFRNRIERDDVQVFELGKKPGIDWMLYFRMWRTFRSLRPNIVHTRNLATIEALVPAWLAGVSRRVHSEHGREMADIDGDNAKFNRVRRFFSWFAHRYVTVSQDLERWIIDDIGISSGKCTQIYNGVDTKKFFPGRVAAPSDTPWAGLDEHQPPFVIGAIGRLAAIKDQALLIRAFAALRSEEEERGRQLFLAIIGDGPAESELRRLVADLSIEPYVWMPGSRNDCDKLLRCFDLFVLPSLNEGISNTILEAMSSGLPVVATAVGGNPELVSAGVTGELFEPGNEESLIVTIRSYLSHADKLPQHGAAARATVERRFSLEVMVARYGDLYRSLAA